MDQFSADEDARVHKEYHPEGCKEVDVVTKRLNIAYDYNFGMGNVSELPARASKGPVLSPSYNPTLLP